MANSKYRIAKGPIPADSCHRGLSPFAIHHSSFRNRGFTLIELITSITVSVIICGLASSILWNATRQQSEASARSELVDTGSAALEIALRYLREIQQNECPGNPTPCLNGNAQILSSSTSSSIRFGNYGFRKSGTNLEMTTDNATNWYVLAADVSDLQLTYYDRIGVDLSALNLQNTRRIVVTLTLARANQTAKIRTGIFLRNFMNEVTSDPS